MTRKELLFLKKILSSKKLKTSYQFIRILSGPTRFKIAIALNNRKAGLTVSELAEVLDASLSRISHQLRILRKYRLVYSKRENREVRYMLANHRLRKFFPF